MVLERHLGARKNASGSFSLRRWAWKRNRVARESSWTQRTTEDQGVAVAVTGLAKRVNGVL